MDGKRGRGRGGSNVSQSILNMMLPLLMFATLAVAFVEVEAQQQFDPPMAPWQSTSMGSTIDRILYQGQPPNVFAPGGRLYFVENMVKAASLLEDVSSNLVVAISCHEGLVIVYSLRQSPHLFIQPKSDQKEMDKDSLHEEKIENQWPLWISDVHNGDEPTSTEFPIIRLSSLSSNSDCPLMAICAGNVVDSQLLQLKIQRLGESALWDLIHTSQAATHNNQHFTQAGVLARHLADHLQVPTQTTGGKSGRILASSALIFGGALGFDKELPLWRIDPTGQFWSCQAAVIGRGCTKAEKHLFESIKATLADESESSDEDESKNETTDHESVQEYLQTCLVDEALSIACNVIRLTLEQSPTPFQLRALVVDRNGDIKRRPYPIRHYTASDIESLLTQ